MKTLELDRTVDAWSQLTHLISVPQSEKECDRLACFLDELIDFVGEDETHPLASLMDVVGVLIENYETQHVPELASERQPVHAPMPE